MRLLVGVEAVATVTLQLAADSRLADADPGRNRRLRHPNLMQRCQLTAPREGFPAAARHAILGMRTGVTVRLSSSDHIRLAAIAADRNNSQKHVWRAQIVLLSAQGVGTTGIMRTTGKAKTRVWRWQQRFMEAGTDGLLIDKTARRASRRRVRGSLSASSR